MLTIKKLTYKIIGVLLLGMPFHYVICECIFKGSGIDNLWRDILLGLSFAFVLFQKKGRLYLGKMGKSIIIADFVVMFYLIVAQNFHAAFSISRTYIVPGLIYFIVINLDSIDLLTDKWLRYIYWTACLVAIYGVFQVFVLGDDFLVNLGYPSQNGYLTSSFYINNFFGNQRVTGTLVSPNICGVFLGIAILILISNNYYDSRKKVILALPIIVALICTFSRSAIIATMLGGGAFYYINSRNKQKGIKINTKILTTIFICVIVLVPLLFFVDKIYLGGLVTKMIQSSFKFNDLSAHKHLEDLYKPIKTIAVNPFGLGFGNNGPKAVIFNANANMVESSIYLCMYDFGILGGLLFLFPYFKTIVMERKSKRDRYQLLAMSIGILLIFTYVLLPNIQEYEPLFYFYFILGIANRKIQKYKNGH